MNTDWFYIKWLKNSVLEFVLLLVVAICGFGVLIYFSIPWLYTWLGAEGFVRGVDHEGHFDMQSYSGFFQAWTGIAITLAGSYVAIKIAQRSHELSSTLALTEKKGELQEIFAETSAIFYELAKAIRAFETASQIVLAATGKLAKKDLSGSLLDAEKTVLGETIQKWLVPAAGELRDAYAKIHANERYVRLLGRFTDSACVLQQILGMNSVEKQIDDSDSDVLVSIFRGDILTSLELLVQRAISVTPIELLSAYHQRLLWRRGVVFLSDTSPHEDAQDAIVKYVLNAYEVSEDLSDVANVWFYDVLAVRIIGAALLQFPINVQVGQDRRKMNINLGMVIFSDLSLAVPEGSNLRVRLYTQDPAVEGLRKTLRKMGLSEEEIINEVPILFGDKDAIMAALAGGDASNGHGPESQLNLRPVSQYFPSLFYDEFKSVRDNATDFHHRHSMLIPVTDEPYALQVRQSSANWLANFTADRLDDQIWSGLTEKVGPAELLRRLQALRAELTLSERSGWSGVRLEVASANLLFLQVLAQSDADQGSLALVRDDAFRDALAVITAFGCNHPTEFERHTAFWGNVNQGVNLETLAFCYWISNLLAIQKFNFLFGKLSISCWDLAAPTGMLALLTKGVFARSLFRAGTLPVYAKWEPSFMDITTKIPGPLTGQLLLDACLELNTWAHANCDSKRVIELDALYDEVSAGATFEI